MKPVNSITMKRMKRIYSVLTVVALLALVSSCGSSETVTPDDEKNKQAGIDPPTWIVDNSLPKADIAGMPAWKVVDFFDYENNTTAMVLVDQSFGLKVTANDRMAAIVDGEVRVVSQPVTFAEADGDPNLLYFMLLIPYRATDNGVDLQYYSDTTKGTYELKNFFTLAESEEGTNRIYLFTFRPYQILMFDIPADLPFTVSKDDKMAMFMGDTCVGVGIQDVTDKGNKIWVIDAYNMNRSTEKAVVRYYSAEKRAIYETEPFQAFTEDVYSAVLKLK